MRLITLCATLVFIIVCYSASNASDFEQSPEGARVFLTFCSGCHGIDGFAIYKPAPSFSMGDRMLRSDSELLNSVLKGKGLMPSWEDKLPYYDIWLAVQYIRTMSKRIEAGLLPRSHGVPDIMYLFRPAGENDFYWWYNTLEN